MFLFVALTLIVGVASAQNKTYTVQQGDTISEIANQHKVRRAELIAANSLPNSHRLVPGMKLRIPARRPEASPLAPPSGTTYYTVRNGDFDWALAKKLGTTVQQLHALNPGVNFAKLPVGVRLAVPAKSTSLIAKAAPAKPIAQAKAPVKTPVVKTAVRTHKVKSGENDWIIARHAGISLSALRQANPGVNTAKLQIGQILKVPGGSLPKTTSTVAKATTPRKITTPYAIVTGSGSTIRRSPSVTAGKITAVDAGTQVKVLDHENGWYKLRFPKGTEGWMRGDLIRPVTSTVVAKSKKTTVAKAPAKPKTKTSIVAAAPRTTVAKRSSRPSLSAGPASSDLIKTAYSQLGTPYKWGSTSRSNGGYDCSGFVTYVYKTKGVKLPRTSRDMARAGQSVSTKNLKSGDLVFFKTGRSSRINHVGMYVGNGKFIHSSSGQGGVRIDSVTSGYYARKLVSARRVANLSPSKPAAPKKPVVAAKPAAPKPDAETTATEE
jgi:cell wall-associated NlpC family hydrolase